MVALSVPVLRPNKIPVDIEHGRIKRTNKGQIKCQRFENIAVFSVSITYFKGWKMLTYDRANNTFLCRTLL